MNQEEIIEIAKNSGYWSGQTIEMNDEGLMHFAEKIADIVRSESESAAWSAYQRGYMDGISRLKEGT